MTENSDSSHDDRKGNCELPESPDAKSIPAEYSRRDALRALGKYSAFVGVTGVVVLSAEDVVAQAPNFTQCIELCNLLPTRRQRRRCRRRCRRQNQNP